MSILQEYEGIKKDMESTRYDAIGDYLNEVNKNRDSKLFLSDILYKKAEYEKYDDVIIEKQSRKLTEAVKN